jgi:uncharacterized protein (TIGR00725 family)
MGGAVASERVMLDAHRLGQLIAERGWVLLTGGRNAGVMAAASRGAAEAGGLVVGILPGDSTTGLAPHVDIAIPTGLGDARNVVNVLASHAIVAMSGGAGTVSEVALALKAGRSVVLLGLDLDGVFPDYEARGALRRAETPEQAVALVAAALEG